LQYGDHLTKGSMATIIISDKIPTSLRCVLSCISSASTEISLSEWN
jgi:hypothetical protein